MDKNGVYPITSDGYTMILHQILKVFSFLFSELHVGWEHLSMPMFHFYFQPPALVLKRRHHRDQGPALLMYNTRGTNRGRKLDCGYLILRFSTVRGPGAGFHGAKFGSRIWAFKHHKRWPDDGWTRRVMCRPSSVGLREWLHRTLKRPAANTQVWCSFLRKQHAHHQPW